MMRVESVNLAATVRTGPWTGRRHRTGIDKRPVAGPVAVSLLGLAGDHVIDDPLHGGADRAVYAFAREDYPYWERYLGRTLPPGSFGENLTTVGLDLTAARIGHRWTVGPVLVEVTAPRIPCRVFAGFWNAPDLIRDFTRHGRPGAYLRVITVGSVRAGDPIAVVGRAGPGPTIGTALRALTTEPELLPELVAVREQLPANIVARLARRLAPV